MNILIKNTNYLDSGFDIKSGDIVILGDKIMSISNQYDTKISFDRVIDGKDKLVIAGLKNCHTHSPMTLLRGLSEDLPLEKWLYDSVFPFESHLTEDDIYWGTKLAILEYLQNGITTIMEMYFFADAIKAASTECCFKTVYTGAVSDIDGLDIQSKICDLESLLIKNNANPYFSVRLGYHADYTASDDLLKLLCELSQKYAAKTYAHASETKKEVENSLQRYGKTPLQRAVDLGLFEYGGAVYHFVHPTKNDLSLLKQKNISVVTNPSSNLKLASGIAPLLSMQKEGISICIGTDGAASNNCLDILKEIYLVSVLQKYLNDDARALSVNQVLKMAFENGANVLQMPDTASIAEGNTADLTILDLNMPNMQPLNDIKSSLVFSANAKNVIMTIVNGKILYEYGNYNIGESPQKIYSKCNQIVKRIASQS